jgi:hypothetical protein
LIPPCSSSRLSAPLIRILSPFFTFLLSWINSDWASGEWRVWNRKETRKQQVLSFPAMLHGSSQRSLQARRQLQRTFCLYASRHLHFVSTRRHL